MREVRIEKDQLRERVQTNRDNHRKLFEKAMDGYQTAAISFFHEQLERAKQGKRFQVVFNEPIPEDHTADYDSVLDMLDMEVSDEIKITSQEFRQYVRDDWGWKTEFLATSSNYINR